MSVPLTLYPSLSVIWKTLRAGAIRSISMEGRMTICNMSVEGGAKAGFVAPDPRPHRPRTVPEQALGRALQAQS